MFYQSSVSMALDNSVKTCIIRSISLPIGEFVAKIRHRRMLQGVPELVDESVGQIYSGFGPCGQATDKLEPYE